MTKKERIYATLFADFSPTVLIVEDESHLHHGHAGWREGGETHMRVKIVAASFEGESRLQRHRRVNSSLAQYLSEGLHALAIEARAPKEAERG